MIAKNEPKFPLGQIVATPGAIEALTDSGESAAQFLHRHVNGDWGDLCEEDKQLNDEAIENGSRILSAYRTKKNVKLWIISEQDRSSTCVLLPEEY